MMENFGKKKMSICCIRRIVLFCLFVGMAVRLPAVMVKLPLSFLVEQSDVIALGRVEDVRCEWSQDGRLILTVVRISLQEVWQGGALPPDFHIQTPGGTIGDLTLRVSDTPDFRLGEDVCLFLQSASKTEPVLRSSTVITHLFSSYTVFGQAQGKWSVDGEGRARRGGFELIEPAGSEDEAVPLSVLKQRVLKEQNRIM
ncbi:MAG: hypothetical protein MUP70_08125, partial [Candidatus Aminicenantes bacterium]|nr:hypothetical protein [Candidatus Aminicenantes bacterium]